MRDSGMEVPLRAKSLDLLLHLVGHAGQVLHKDHLLTFIWKDVSVTDDSLTQCIRDIRVALGDKDQSIVRTIPRRGYLFAADKLNLDGVSNSVRLPSIAVMPFRAMNTDADQEFFSDGITEDITTALGKFKGFFVIARNTMLGYKGKAVDLRELSAELGVRYVLNGSVRRAGDKLRVTAELNDAGTIGRIWGESYDRTVDDVFAIQDMITSSVVSRIGPEIFAAEHARASRKPPESLGSWECTLRGLFLGSRLSERETREAMALLDRAIELDRGHAQAMGIKAWLLSFRAVQGWEDRARAIRAARELTTRALEADGGEPWTWLGLGSVGLTSRDNELATQSILRAVELNPNFAMAHGLLGLAHAFGGRSTEAILSIDHASRLSPRELFHGAFPQQYAFAHFQAGAYAQSLANAKRAHELRPGHTYPMIIAAASAAHLGDAETALSFMTALKAALPSISLAWLDLTTLYTQADDQHRLRAGLMQAGLT